jgi:ketosteroid isomerase-like protein
VYEPSEVENIVRKWFRAYSEKDFETHNALIHPDAVVVYPEMCFVDPDLSAGKDFLEKTLEKDEANFIDLRMTIDDLWVVGDSAFVEGHFSGNTLGGTIVDQAKASEIKLRSRTARSSSSTPTTTPRCCTRSSSGWRARPGSTRWLHG